MTSDRMSSGPDGVGPVLQAGDLADAIVAAIRSMNQHVKVEDRGSYVRVSVPGQCLLSREAVSYHLGAPFVFPRDLELVMLSFKGRLQISTDEASWS